MCSSFLSLNAFADEFGTKDEAVALLERAVAIVRIDKNRALDLFTRREGGLTQKDLYVFCFAPNGTILAHPSIVGLNVFENDLLDVQGNPLGESLFNAETYHGFRQGLYEDEFVNSSCRPSMWGRLLSSGITPCRNAIP